MTDPHNLQRFITAQQPIYETAIAELSAGRKQSHWMWFIFPQIHGLGHSALARQFAIANADEARAYLLHPVLGARITTCSEIVLQTDSRSIDQIFGSPDNLKFCSSMTLFAKVDAVDNVFAKCLDKYFAGRHDALTLALLNG